MLTKNYKFIFNNKNSISITIFQFCYRHNIFNFFKAKVFIILLLLILISVSKYLDISLVNIAIAETETVSELDNFRNYRDKLAPGIAYDPNCILNHILDIGSMLLFGPFCFYIFVYSDILEYGTYIPIDGIDDINGGISYADYTFDDDPYYTSDYYNYVQYAESSGDVYNVDDLDDVDLDFILRDFPEDNKESIKTSTPYNLTKDEEASINWYNQKYKNVIDDEVFKELD